jgi:hypothetical protein
MIISLETWRKLSIEQQEKLSRQLAGVKNAKKLETLLNEMVK